MKGINEDIVIIETANEGRKVYLVTNSTQVTDVTGYIYIPGMDLSPYAF